MTMLYRPILRQAWKITWRNKFLWFFGFFVALWGNSGAYELIFSTPERLSWQKDFWLSLQNSLTAGSFLIFLKSLPGLISQVDSLTLLIILILGSLIILLFLIWLSVISIGAIIQAVTQINKRRQITFHAAMRSGRQVWGRILSIFILAKLAIGLLFVFLSLYLIYFTPRSETIGLTFALVTTVVFIAFSLIVYFLAIYAVNSVVLEKTHLVEAIYRGWSTFRRAPLISLEMALLLLLINLALAIVLLLIGTIVILPLLQLFDVFILINFVTVFYVFFFLITLTLLALFILLSAGFAVFQLACWTTLYQEINKGRAFSKVRRLVHGLPKI